MCVRALLNICVLLMLFLTVACGTQTDSTGLDLPQYAETQVEDEELQQEILLLHKALRENPQPRNAGDFGWTGYYPYLDLGKAYLKIKDPFSASYYCSRSKSEGFSPAHEVEECLDAVAVIFKSYKKGMTARSLSFEFPSFPWPPPEASSSSVLSSSYFIDSDTHVLLKDVAARLECALFYAGYVEFSYYQIPEGFALVTRVEQFHDSGASKAPPDRWALEMPPAKIFSLGDYLKALFRAEKGHYRLITFLVTSVPFRQSQRDISREDAMAWLFRGANVLPPEIGEQPYSKDHYCTALIYEFEQMTRDHDAELKSPGMLTGNVHLTGALLWESLKKLSQETTP